MKTPARLNGCSERHYNPVECYRTGRRQDAAYELQCMHVDIPPPDNRTIIFNHEVLPTGRTKFKSSYQRGAVIMKTEIKIAVDTIPDTFAQALGITEKREEQLCDLIGQCYDSTDTYPQAIAGISLKTKNINELAYAIFHFGAYAGEERARQEMIQILEG